MSLELELSQKQILSQRTLQSLEILQMSALELEQYVNEAALNNPVIDMEESSASAESGVNEMTQRKLDWLESTDYQNRVYYDQERRSLDTEGNWHNSYDEEERLSDYLLSQTLLMSLSSEERRILDYLIYSLDDRGYFTVDIPTAAEFCEAAEDNVQKMLQLLQTLDPAGVGARDLQECLLIQLDRSDTKDSSVDLARILVRNHLNDLAKSHLNIIARKLNLTLQEVEAAARQITRLNAKPGSSFSRREQMVYISPDVIVVKLENCFDILINEYQYPKFSINSYYQNLLRSTDDAETQKYLRDKISQAEWLSGCIQQRSSTLSGIMMKIMDHQMDFFVYGPGYKKPMKLTELAEELDIHESTVSRALRSKYLQCSWGIFPLSYFLTGTVTHDTTSQDGITPDALKEKIRQVIDGEDKKKPLSDQAICERLKALNINISRRTVNKYRSEMGIPDKSGRKQ